VNYLTELPYDEFVCQLGMPNLDHFSFFWRHLLRNGKRCSSNIDFTRIYEYTMVDGETTDITHTFVYAQVQFIQIKSRFASAQPVSFVDLQTLHWKYIISYV
jgi:hypothetical protein